MMVMDYLDEDVAYFLGMLVARGSILIDSGTYIITIEIPYTNIQIDDPPYNDHGDVNALLRSVDKIIRRLKELITDDVDKIEGDRSVSIVITVKKRNILVRDLEMLLKGRVHFTEFLIPDEIFDAELSIQKEFMRGFVDVNGKVRSANYYYNKENRIYIDVLNTNWILPIQLCRLLQKYLDVPVQTLTWGHPNLRDTTKKTWLKREHQIKVFNNCFRSIGFYIDHKNKKFLELADENDTNELATIKCRDCVKCDPLIKMQRSPRVKPTHLEEGNEDLPIELRGNHYNSYWEICRDLECKAFDRQKTMDDFSLEIKKIPKICTECKYFNEGDNNCYIDADSGSIYNILDPDDGCFEGK